MPKMLNDGAVEYEDGTPATEAQVSSSDYSFSHFRMHIPFEAHKFCLFSCSFVLSPSFLVDGERCGDILILGCGA